MILNSIQIQQIIPHRRPFLLVDRVLELEPGIRTYAYKNITANEEVFSGHFPDEPVYPGALIVEALAQAGAITILSKDENKGKLVYFTGIDKCKFKKKVIPGDRLFLETKLIKQRSIFGIAEAKAYVNAELVCEAIIKFAIEK